MTSSPTPDVPPPSPRDQQNNRSSSPNAFNGLPTPPRSRRNSGSESSSPQLSGNLDRYQVVDDICNEGNYYRILGVKRTSSLEEIRKAYITKSRICHPDKLREYPKATEAFQKLSVAYDTLSKPSTRRIYDLSGGLTRSKNHAGGSEISTDGDATLHAVLYQLLEEFMTNGEFDTIRSYISAINDTTTGLDLSEEMIESIEITFQKLRDVSIVATKYIRLVKFELMKLYELQHAIRKLSYFDVFGRLALTIRISKLILRIPIIINVASKIEGPMEKELCYEETSGVQGTGTGLFGDRVEGMLRMMVAALEAGEKLVAKT